MHGRGHRFQKDRIGPYQVWGQKFVCKERQTLQYRTFHFYFSCVSYIFTKFSHEFLTPTETLFQIYIHIKKMVVEITEE